MKLNLTTTALDILRLVITQSGDTEVREGQDVASALRLNGTESAQRRHFLKVADPILTDRDETRTEAVEGAKEEWKKANKKGDKEDDKTYDVRMVTDLNKNEVLIQTLTELADKKHDIDLTDDTVDVLKKYYTQYGDKVGWGIGDDVVVEELNEALNID